MMKLSRRSSNYCMSFRICSPQNFSEMKGIFKDLEEMKIPLKHYANLVKQRPYWLNPQYKEKVKIELDQTLDAGIIEPVEESEWINPMVV